jgi:hypothetical protein
MLRKSKVAEGDGSRSACSNASRKILNASSNLKDESRVSPESPTRHRNVPAKLGDEVSGLSLIGNGDCRPENPRTPLIEEPIRNRLLNDADHATQQLTETVSIGEHHWICAQ